MGIVLSYLYSRIKRKYDGVIQVSEDAYGVKTFSINLDDEDPWNLDQKKRVIFKIQSNQPPS